MAKEKKPSWADEEIETPSWADTEEEDIATKTRKAIDVKSQKDIEDISTRFSETFEDIKTVIPDAMTLNWIDEMAMESGIPPLKLWGMMHRVEAKRARERSPYATMATEMLLPPMVGEMKTAATQIPKIGKAAQYLPTTPTVSKSALKSTAVGAVSGAGYGEDRAERLLYGGIGAGMAGLTSAAFNLAKKYFVDPKAIKQRALGGGRTSFKTREGSPRNPEENLNAAAELGLLSFKPVKYDPKKGAFKRDPKGIPLGEGPEFHQNLILRTRQAREEINKQVVGLLNKHNQKVSSDDLDGFDPFIKDLEKIERRLHRSIGEEKADKIIMDELEQIYKELDNFERMFDDSGEIVYDTSQRTARKTNLHELRELKSDYQSMVDSIYAKEAKGGDIRPDEKARQQVKEMIAKNLRRLLENKVGADGDKLALLNRKYGGFSNIEDTLLIEGKAGYKASEPTAATPKGQTTAYLTGKAAETMGTEPEAALIRASVGEAIEKIPSYIRRPVEKAARMYPVLESERVLSDPNTSPAFNMLYDFSDWIGREPQSMEKDPISQLIEVEFPRSTEAIMENPKVFLAKVAQVTNDQNLTVMTQQALKNPQKLKAFLPFLANQVPGLFQMDEYNRFDGKFIDPEDRRRYIEDIGKRDDISPYEKAEVVDFANKENEALL